MTIAPSPSSTDALPAIKHDYLPVLLPIALSALALPFVGNPTTWVTLTVAASPWA
jgi:branched-chain amino acid transport system permease protein